MNKRTWELWGIPTIIGIGMLIAGVYINAWATGVQLRPPFTLGWITSLLSLSVQMPLWMILVILAVTAVSWLVLRRRIKVSAGPATTVNAAEAKSEIEIPAQFPPSHPAFPAEGTDGSHHDLVRYIMHGQDQLLAYTTTRDGIPGTRFLVVRQRPDREPQSVSAPDRETANAKWTEWYREWKQRGFGGAFGNFDGEPPF